MNPNSGHDADPLHCRGCASRLGHDQRYCLECGTRRGPLPRPVAEMLGTMLEQGRGPRPAPEPIAEPAWAFDAELPFGLTMPSPRAAAVAVLGMLTLGVILGTTVAPPVQTFAANSPVVLVSPHSLASSALGDLGAGDLGGGGDNGGGGGGTETITVVQTTTAPSGSGSAAGGDLSGGGSSAPIAASGGGSTPTNPYGLPPVKHLFLIMLSDVGFGQSFGSQDTYLAKTLPRQGKLIYDYYAVAGSGLANGIALTSGQGPTRQTMADCPAYSELRPGTTDRHHQVRGDGCIYPKSAQTLPGELTAKKDTWRAYVEGVDTGPPDQPSSCRHPAVGQPDADHAPRPGDSYVTWRNPFVYFDSIIHGTGCQKNDVGLGGLSFDLQNANTAPTVAFIIPGPCDDGNPQPCNAGAEGGVAPADRFLQTVVPEIEQSAAYQDNGLIAITSDEAPQAGPNADSSACCGNPTYPNLTSTGAADPPTTTPTTTTTTPTVGVTTPTVSATTPTVSVTTPTVSTTTTTTSTSTTTTTSTSTTTTGATTSPTPSSGLGGETTPTGGGGQVGLLLISKFVKKGTADTIDYYNHYSLLETIENLFGLKKLGYSAAKGLPYLDSSLFDGTPTGGAADRSSRMTASKAPRMPRAARPHKSRRR